MDISLNGQLDGIEAARMIKAKFDIPIIFMTGYSSDDLREKTAKICKNIQIYNQNAQK